MDDKMHFELEKVRHDYNLRFADLWHRHQMELWKLIAQVESLEQEITRIKELAQRQDGQLEHLLIMGQEMEREATKAITPNNIRNWIIGLAGLIGAVMLILSTIESYNQSQVIKHQEKRWIEDQRQQQSYK